MKFFFHVPFGSRAIFTSLRVRPYPLIVKYNNATLLTFIKKWPLNGLSGYHCNSVLSIKILEPVLEPLYVQELTKLSKSRLESKWNFGNCLFFPI